MEIFKGLQPELVWSYFEEICKIPRPSKKEEKMAYKEFKEHLSKNELLQAQSCLKKHSKSNDTFAYQLGKLLLENYDDKENIDNGIDICTMTANQFDNTQLYNTIIVVGNISGKRFDTLRCRSSQEINLLLYECERYRYKKQVRDAKAFERLLNNRSTIPIDYENEEDP